MGSTDGLPTPGTQYRAVGAKQQRFWEEERRIDESKVWKGIGNRQPARPVLPDRAQGLV